MTARSTTVGGTFYGGCGVEGCEQCRPLFDADNREIPGTADPAVSAAAETCTCECSPPEFGGNLLDADCPIHAGASAATEGGGERG